MNRGHATSLAAAATAPVSTAVVAENAATRFRRVRAASLALAEGLSPEDQQVQSMPDASPVKWHLAHSSWFFETFLLVAKLPRYRLFDSDFGYLFNSYYEMLGERHPRATRGLLTRPSLDRVLAYRRHVDEGMARLIATGLFDEDAGAAHLLSLGLAHEEQHQELILMDVLHLLSLNPLIPVYRRIMDDTGFDGQTEADGWFSHQGGIVRIGHAMDDPGFAFDNEGPQHDALLSPFRLARAPVSNADWLCFIEDGGYDDARLWLSDGWTRRQAEGWKAPAYWRGGPGGRSHFTLSGELALDPSAPVAHVSFYEADAFARWAGHRLPSEGEWEVAAATVPTSGNLLGQGPLRPSRQPIEAAQPDQPGRLFGDVWEWTASPYGAYPGFRPARGAVGEYNGKFMVNQFVLRGGSCATPSGHIRATYRNFFYPGQRWMFSGVRLASDA